MEVWSQRRKKEQGGQGMLKWEQFQIDGPSCKGEKPEYWKRKMTCPMSEKMVQR